MARFLRTETNSSGGHSRLKPPVAVKPAFNPETQRIRTVRVTLAPSTRLARRSHPFLRAPVVVKAAPVLYPVAVTLAPQKRGKPKSHLSPPTVVASGPLRPIQVNLAVDALRRNFRVVARIPKSHLFPPSGGPGIAFHGPGVRLAKPRDTRPQFLSRLRPPVVTDVAQTFSGPHVTLVRVRPKRTVWLLGLPRVVHPSTTFSGPSVSLGPSRRGVAKSRLPVITYEGRVYEPIAGYLTKPLDRVPRTISRLSPPATLSTGAVFSGPRVEMARIEPPRTIARLEPPTVIDLRPQAFYISTTLVRIRPVATLWALHPPTDLIDTNDLGVVKTHLAYSRRGVPYSILRKPVVIGAGIAYYGPGRRLARSFRVIPTKSRLGAPVITTAEVVFFGPNVTLAKIRPPRVLPFLRAPVVVQAAAYLRPVHVTIAPSTRGIAKSRLPLFIPAAVVQTFSGPQVTLAPSTLLPRQAKKSLPGLLLVTSPTTGAQIVVTLAKSQRPSIHSRLAPPVAVSPVLARPIDITLARITPPPVRSLLRDPVAIDLRPQAYFISTTLVRIRPVRTRWALRPPTDLIDAVDLGYVSVTLAPQKRGVPKSKLRLPTVIDLRPQTYFVAITLAPSFRGKPKSILRGPRDLVDAQDLGAVRTHLAYSSRGKPKSRLKPPAVVAPVLARPIVAKLVRIRPVRTIARIEPPTVIDLRPQAFYISTTLVRIRPQPIHSILRKPTDLLDAADLGFVKTHLAYSRRGVPKSSLRKPTVIGAGIAFHGPGVRLALSFRGIPKSILRKPVVIGAGIAYYGPGRRLARSFRVIPTKSKLSPPVVTTRVAVFFGPQITLIRILPVRVRPFLRAPVVVQAAAYLRPTDVTLAPSRRGLAKSRLSPPTLVVAPLQRPVLIHLAPSTRLPRQAKKSLPQLIPVSLAFVAGAVRITLAPSLFGSPKSHLAPPVVVNASRAARPLLVHLAYSKRGKPLSGLGRPIVVDAPAAYFAQGPLVQYAPSSRGKAKSFLKPPVTVVTAVLARAIIVRLARIRPVHTIAILRPPKDLVDRQDLGFVRVHLAYSLRGKAKSKLRIPVVVAPVLARPSDITLTRIRPAAVRSILRDPAVIDVRPQTFYLTTWLSYSLRGKPKSTLRLTKIVFRPQFDSTVLVHLAYQTRGKPKSKLRAPAVVGNGIYFRGILVTRAPSRLPKPKSRLFPVTVVARPVGLLNVTLAPSRLSRPKSFLRAPVVVQSTFFPRAILVHLAPSTRLPRQAKKSLPQLLIVRPAPPARGLLIHLAYSKRGKPLSFVRPPVVVNPAVQIYPQGPAVILAYSVRGKPLSGLGKPIVVNTPPAYFAQGPLVQYTYSSRGKAKSRLTFTQGITTRPGIVCSEVLDLTEVCGDTTDLSGILLGVVLDEDVAGGEDVVESDVISENLDIYRADGEVL